MFPFHYQGLWCLVCCWGWFCQFVIIDSTLPPSLVSTDFDTCSYQCFLSSYAPVSLHMLKYSLVFLCTVLLPILGMLICGLLSHQIVGKVCTCHLSLSSIFLSCNILFLTLGLVLPLFHFQFLLLSLPSIARGTCLLHFIIIIIIVIIIIIERILRQFSALCYNRFFSQTVLLFNFRICALCMREDINLTQCLLLVFYGFGILPTYNGHYWSTSSHLEPSILFFISG